MNTFSTSAGTASDRAALIASTLKAANGDTLNCASQMNAAAVATHTFSSDIRTAAKNAKESTLQYLASVVNLKSGAVDYNKSAAAPLIANLQGMQSAAMAAAQATFQHARATMSGKDAADAAYKVYKSQTSGQLVDQLKKLGANTAEAHRLASEYFGMPKDVKTLIEAQGTNPIVTVLNKIGHQLSFLSGHPWKPKLGIDNHQAITGIASVENKLNALHDKTIHINYSTGGHTLPQNANGGGLPLGWSSVGERGTELVYNRGGSAHVFSHGQSRGILAATGMRAPGFAGGTDPSFTVGGKTYKNLANAVAALTAALTGYNPRSVHALTAAMQAVFAHPGKSPKFRVAGETYSTVRQAEKALDKAVRLMSHTLTRLGGRDLTKFSKAIGKTGDDVKSAFSAWLADAKAAGMDRAHRRTLTAEAQSVAHLVNVRNRDQSRLHSLIANRAAEKHTVAAAVSGSFDITSAGTNPSGAGVSFGALRAQQLQQARIVHKWAAGIRKLGKEGFNKSPTGLAMLRQLAEGGPGDWPQVQALLSASPKQLAGVISTERSIDRAGAKLGGYVGSQLYDSRIAHQRTVVQADIRDLRQTAHRLERQMERIANRSEKIVITLDGKKVASGTAVGARKNARRG